MPLSMGRGRGRGRGVARPAVRPVGAVGKANQANGPVRHPPGFPRPPLTDDEVSKQERKLKKMLRQVSGRSSIGLCMYDHNYDCPD